MNIVMNSLYFYDLYIQNLKWMTVAAVILAGVSSSSRMAPQRDCVAADLVITWLCGLMIRFIGFLIGTPLAIAITEGLFLTVVLCKDVVNGRSLGKRIGNNMQVVYASTGKPVSPLLSIIRNVFELFWFVDFIPWLLGGSRLADYMLNTKVVQVDDYGYLCRTYYIFTRDMLFWILTCFVVCTGVMYLLRNKLEWLLSFI